MIKFNLNKTIGICFTDTAKAGIQRLVSLDNNYAILSKNHKSEILAVA